MASHATRVKADIERWVSAGLIDRGTAERLAQDIAEHDRRSLSFGSILAVLAALLLGAAVLIFVAANWEAIPRITRVAMLFGTIFAGYVGGAFLKANDYAAIGEAAWLVAAAAFGGSIALIGQMYHLSGDEASAVLTWCAGTALAAVALRSNPLTVAAAGIAAAWLFLKGFEYFRADDFPHLFLAIAAVIWAISYWTLSAPARHLIILSLILYAAMLAVDTDAIGVGAVLAAISALLLAASVLAPGPTEKLVRLDGNLPVHAILGFMVGIGMIQLEWMNDPGFLPASAIALAGIAAAILLGGRESRGLRWIAYVGFAFELCLIYTVTVGSMLGTAGFFLAAAVILGLLAFAIIRVEKRMKAPSTTGAAA